MQLTTESYAIFVQESPTEIKLIESDKPSVELNLDKPVKYECRIHNPYYVRLSKLESDLLIYIFDTKDKDRFHNQYVRIVFSVNVDTNATEFKAISITNNNSLDAFFRNHGINIPPHPALVKENDTEEE